jgi:hypothetical protein
MSLQDPAQLLESSEIFTKSVIKSLLDLPNVRNRSEV